MSFAPARVTVQNTPTRLDTATDANAGSGNSLLVANRGTVAVYLGKSDVASTTGYQMDPGESIGVDLDAGDQLWAITASGTCVVHVLQVGV